MADALRATVRDSDLTARFGRGLPNKVLAAEYRTALPEEQRFVEEIERARRQIALRRR